MNRIAWLRAALIVSLLASGLGFAADAGKKQAPDSEARPAYVSGGIGDDEVIDSTKKDYNLHLVFAAKGSGEYLADVNVAIQKASGTWILETLSPGPLFYVRLPSGSYRITAEFGGVPISRPVVIKEGRSNDLYFYWE